jgi:hypothetical protein
MVYLSPGKSVRDYLPSATRLREGFAHLPTMTELRHPCKFLKPMLIWEVPPPMFAA